MDNHNSADLEEIRKPKNATKDERGLPQSIDNDATEREVGDRADEIKSEPDDPRRLHKDEPCSRAAAKGMSANDRKMRSSLKRLSLSNIPEMEEVEMTKEDGTAIHSNNPKLDDSLDANTAVEAHFTGEARFLTFSVRAPRPRVWWLLVVWMQPGDPSR